MVNPMAEDDIESYWEGIRPSREPVLRDLGDLRKEITSGKDEVGVLIRVLATQGDRVLIRDALESVIDQTTRRSGYAIDQFSDGIAGVNPELLRFLVHWYCINGPFLSWGEVPNEIVEALEVNIEARQAFRNRDEALREGAEPGLDLAPIRQALLAELGREPTMQDVYDRQAQEELEAAMHRGDRPETPAGGFPGTTAEWARYFVRTVPRWVIDHERNLLQRSLGREPTLEELNQVLLAAEVRRRESPTLNMQPSQRELVDLSTAVDEESRRRAVSQLNRRRAMYAQIARESTVEQVDSDWPPGVPAEQRHLAPTLEEARAFVHGDFLSPSPPAAPHEEFSVTRSILTRIADDLGALGFLPESITIERSIEGAAQSLTIHMPVTQLTQLTGPGHSSVIFTQRR
jgi:hypothetical protein